MMMTNFFNNRKLKKEKKRIKKEYWNKYRKFLPNYYKDGEKIEWFIVLDENNEYDVQSGKLIKMDITPRLMCSHNGYNYKYIPESNVFHRWDIGCSRTVFDTLFNEVDVIYDEKFIM